MYDESWIKAQKVVLGYIFCNGKPAMQKVFALLHVEYFSGQLQQLWKVFSRFYTKYAGVITLQVMREEARKIGLKEDVLFEYEQLLAECEEQASEVTDSEFLWYIGRLRELYQQVEFMNLVNEGTMSFQKEGLKLARQKMMAGLNKLESDDVEHKIETTIIDEVDNFIEEVGNAKEAMYKEAVHFGLPGIDNYVLGLRPGDCILIAGFAEVGKTALCVNTCVEAIANQQKNVLFVTTETVSKELLRRLFGRISKLPLFNSPINSTHFKSGQLTKEERETLQAIKKWIKTGKHGRLGVVQAPSGATLAWLKGVMYNYEQKFKLDLVILDDLRNMKPTVRRRQEWEEFNDMIKDFKMIARTHAGRGVPLITPYQISREGQKRIMLESSEKRYKLMDLSSSSEAERTPDLIVTLARLDNDAPNDVTFDILKLRGGKPITGVKLKVQFEHQYFYELDVDDLR